MGRRRAIAIAGTAVAAAGLVAGGATYAATNGRSSEQAAALAAALNKRAGTDITADQVAAAMQDVLKERLDRAVEDGRLTQEQADAILERAAQGDPGPGLGFGGRGGGPFWGRGASDVLTPAAKALGITADALQKQLSDGKTIAEVAEARKVDVQKVIDAVTDALLAAAKDRGHDLSRANAAARAKTIVERQAPPGGPPGGHRGWGPPGGRP
ncbi:MAG: hypothetical protein AB7V42_15115 [Thermoleophilia bacterium]